MNCVCFHKSMLKYKITIRNGIMIKDLLKAAIAYTSLSYVGDDLYFVAMVSRKT